MEDSIIEVTFTPLVSARDVQMRMRCLYRMAFHSVCAEPNIIIEVVKRVN